MRDDVGALWFRMIRPRPLRVSCGRIRSPVGGRESLAVVSVWGLPARVALRGSAGSAEAVSEGVAVAEPVNAEQLTDQATRNEA